MTEYRPNQPPQDNREAGRKRWLDTVSRARRGAVAFGAGGVGVAITGIISEPSYNPELAIYMAVKLVSYVSMISGGYITFHSLADMADFARTHIHPRSHEVPPHKHDGVLPHQHKQEDIIFPKPPSPDELRRQQMLRFIEENDMKGKYREGLEELGLSARTINALLRNASPYRGMPLSIGGLRVFLKLGIPIKGNNISSGTRAEIAEKVTPITYPETIEDYQRLTRVERDQMVKNGFVQIM